LHYHHAGIKLTSILDTVSISRYLPSMMKNRILREETITPSPDCGCKSNITQTLAQMGVKYMLAWNMGQGAVDTLGMSEIRVLRSCSSNVRNIVDSWLTGKLNDSGISCAKYGHDWLKA
jgi:predicted Fe-Mo cluster-binding NifX family protein